MFIADRIIEIRNKIKKEKIPKKSLKKLREMQLTEKESFLNDLINRSLKKAIIANFESYTDFYSSNILDLIEKNELVKVKNLDFTKEVNLRRKFLIVFNPLIIFEKDELKEFLNLLEKYKEKILIKNRYPFRKLDTKFEKINKLLKNEFEPSFVLFFSELINFEYKTYVKLNSYNNELFVKPVIRYFTSKYKYPSKIGKQDYSFPNLTYLSYYYQEIESLLFELSFIKNLYLILKKLDKKFNNFENLIVFSDNIWNFNFCPDYEYIKILFSQVLFKNQIIVNAYEYDNLIYFLKKFYNKCYSITKKQFLMKKINKKLYASESHMDDLFSKKITFKDLELSDYFSFTLLNTRNEKIYKFKDLEMILKDIQNKKSLNLKKIFI